MKTMFRTMGIGILVVLLFSSFFAVGDGRADDRKVQFVFKNLGTHCAVFKKFGSEVSNLKLEPGAVIEMMLPVREYNRNAQIDVEFSVFNYGCEGFATWMLMPGWTFWQPPEKFTVLEDHVVFVGWKEDNRDVYVVRLENYRDVPH
ncbi:MAG: hypothetical protein JW821_19175 [Deltaproteobacteria bacterium]|nr:hypothetical protein [Deltaproteobacteria bacterium]